MDVAEPQILVVRSAGDETVQYGGVQVGRKTAHAPGVFLAVFSSVGSRCKGPSPIRRARRGSARRQVLTGARNPPLGPLGTACAARSVNSRFESEPSRCPPVECGIHDARGVTPYLRLVGRWLTAHDRPRRWEGTPALSELRWYL
jgi:hypothetical protein